MKWLKMRNHSAGAFVKEKRELCLANLEAITLLKGDLMFELSI